MDGVVRYEDTDDTVEGGDGGDAEIGIEGRGANGSITKGPKPLLLPLSSSLLLLPIRKLARDERGGLRIVIIGKDGIDIADCCAETW
jgi:hypothetical protein